ncbi:DUF5110 domain-containing protein [Mucilaginibacter antarcticus]
MQNIIQSTNEQGDGVLQIHIWNGDDTNTFVYYEDDGATYSYQSGSYHKRTITFDPQKREIVFNPVEGEYQSKYHKLELVGHGLDGVQLNRQIDNTNEVFAISY